MDYCLQPKETGQTLTSTCYSGRQARNPYCTASLLPQGGGFTLQRSAPDTRFGSQPAMEVNLMLAWSLLEIEFPSAEFKAITIYSPLFILHSTLLSVLRAGYFWGGKGGGGSSNLLRFSIPRNRIDVSLAYKPRAT